MIGAMRSLGVVVRAAVAVLVATGCSSSSSSTAKPNVSTTVTAPASSIPTPPGLQVATVSPVARQTIQGFGASGAWWVNDLAKFPTRVQQQVAKLLFSSDGGGIGLWGYRYNIGGGGVGVTTPARAPKAFADDAAGLYFLHAASAAKVQVLTGFVNSAPPSFTTNAKACGGSLRPGLEAAYAKYVVGVVTTLHDRDHVTLNYLSPMNEPDDSFGSCGQEGMQVPVAQRAAVIQALGKELAAHAPYTKVIADETTADVILSTEAPVWLAVPAAAQYVAAIAHHTYDFPTDALRQLLPPISAKFHKPTWMTEICCYKGSGGVASSFGANYDPTMTQGFWLADQIESDFTVAGDRAWYWWTALSSAIGCDPKADPGCPSQVNTKGFNDGLLYYDANGATNGDTKIYTTKRFYVLGQFSRYVKPGAVLRQVTGLPKGAHAMAFESEKEWTVVTWNEGKMPANFGLKLPASVKAHTAVITNTETSLASRPVPARTDSGSWLVQLPPGTIATYTFST